MRDRILLRVRPAVLASLLKRLLGVRRREVETPAGRLWLDPVSNLGAQLADNGAYEPAMAAALERHLAPGGVFVDVGANEGYFSLLAARLVGPSGRVVAIEPQGRLRPIIERNLALNAIHNVMILEVAVADCDGEALLHLAPDTNTGSTGLAPATRYRLPTQRVRAARLATLLAEAGIERVDLLKIDIEGFEVEAILGSREIFEQGRVATIALELHPAMLERRGRRAADIEALLRASGYRRDQALAGVVWSRGAA